MLLALAWRNLWRRPQRTVLSLISIALVSALLVALLSFQTAVYATMTEATLRIFDGFAELQPAGYHDDPGLDRAIAQPAVLVQSAATVPGVGAAAPRVNTFAILAAGPRSYGAYVVGVEPAREARVSSIAHTITTGRYLNEADSDSAVLGDALARDLQVGVGGKVSLLGQARDGSVAADVLRVVGVYHSGVPELDRTILEMPFARAQDTFGMDGAASTIAVGGTSLAAVDRALPGLKIAATRAGVSLLDWQALEPALRDGIALKYATAAAFYATLVLVVAFIILNTLLMSVLERTREFGMLMALGMRPAQIGLMVWLELTLLAALGCAIGIAIGGGFTLWLQRVGVDFSGLGAVLAQYGLPPRLYPALSPLSALAGPGAILTAILIGGLVPHARIARLTPALAMRGA